MKVTELLVEGRAGVKVAQSKGSQKKLRAAGEMEEPGHYHKKGGDWEDTTVAQPKRKKVREAQDVSSLEVGDEVTVQRAEDSEPVKAVVVDRNKNAVAVSRLRKDGTVREERLWTGTYYSVTKR